jgi:hypothetical protein
MTYAQQVEGYDAVYAREDYFKSGQFIPMGDPVKAAKVMIELVDHPAPPVHLILGSDSIGLLTAADKARKEDMEKWLSVSASTDHDTAEDFLQTKMGQSFTKS